MVSSFITQPDLLEKEARNEGQTRLITEASLMSYPLFLKFGWTEITFENILIGGVAFKRYRMEKKF